MIVDLRFIERDVTVPQPQLGDGWSIVNKVRILQMKRAITNNGVIQGYKEWEDVPLFIDIPTQPL